MLAAQPFSSIISPRYFSQVEFSIIVSPNLKGFDLVSFIIFCLFCGEKEEMSHVYECNILSSNEIMKIEYEEIYRNNPIKQKEILQRFERNLEKRQNIQNNKNELRKEIFTEEKRKIPCDLLLDPLNYKRFSFG